MPIFEYVCKECSHQFEAIVNGSKQVECPTCHSGRLEKQLSVFAVGAGRDAGFTSRPSAGPCGTCGDPRGPGACSLD